jgi:type I restriction enzyme R subunit
MAMIAPERQLEEALVTKIRDLKYEYRPDIRDRATLEANFREKFEALNRVTLIDSEFQRLLEEIVPPDVYGAAQSLRNREAFIRDDRQHQGLVQERLRVRQSAPHQYGQQPSPLRRLQVHAS